jgi:hypothetical protein
MTGLRFGAPRSNASARIRIAHIPFSRIRAAGA